GDAPGHLGRPPVPGQLEPLEAEPAHRAKPVDVGLPAAPGMGEDMQDARAHPASRWTSPMTASTWSSLMPTHRGSRSSRALTSSVTSIRVAVLPNRLPAGEE